MYYYSAFGILALVILFLMNPEVLRPVPESRAIQSEKPYRRFVLSCAVFYVLDVSWALLYERRLIPLVYIVSVLYFLAIGACVLSWSRFIVHFLKRQDTFGRVLMLAGRGIMLFEAAALVVNCFCPFFFRYGPDGVFLPGPGRMIFMLLQEVLFLGTAVYSLSAVSRVDGKPADYYRSVGLGSLIMAVFIFLQALNAFLPFCAVGSLLVICLIRSFVLSDMHSRMLLESSAAEQEARLRHVNRYDDLTGLPNLSWFFHLADTGKRKITASGRQFVLLYVDLNGMKYFNHRYGFAEGDNLLKGVAGCISRAFGEDRVCHCGADRFAAFSEENGVENKLKQLFDEVGRLNHGRTLPVQAGIYSCGMENLPVELAYDRAKVACDELHKADGSVYQFYSQEMRDRLRLRQYVQLNLDRALREKWVEVYYQPIVRAMNEKICDMEALARWNDPIEGMLSPADFIPHLEEAGQIYKLDLYVLDRVLEELRSRKEAGLPVIPHSINLSRSDFDACDIAEEVRARVDAAGISRDKIAIEITESLVGSSFDFMKAQIERIRSFGFPVWMDDFGSGYSSLDVLQSIRFELVKFDMSFMRKLDEGKEGKIILTELMKLSSSLGLETICEGVETREQVHFLQEIGCSRLQGYYYSKPLSSDEIAAAQKSGALVGDEDPAEAAYFGSIGRLSLFDLSVIAQEKDDQLQNAFDTIPMGIVEVRGRTARFTRSNPSYRAFIQRFFGVDLSELPPDFFPFSDDFMQNIVKSCVEQGIRSFYDEIMPDGSVVHSFARRIAVNPLNGDAAVAVAVLSVTDAADSETESYANIARALAMDYYNIYVVDLDTEKFIEYSSPVGEDDIAVERHGTSFFQAAQEASLTRIYEEDREFFLSWFTRENVIRELDSHGVFTASYRLMDTGVPMYASLKINRMPGGNRIILGVSIVDSQMKQREQMEFIRKERDLLARVMAVSEGYLCLYSIQPDTGKFVEYSASEEYRKLKLGSEGSNFFSWLISFARKAVHPEDQTEALRHLTRGIIRREIQEKGDFRIHFRLMLEEPRQVTLKIVPYGDSDGEKWLMSLRAWIVRNA